MVMSAGGVALAVKVITWPGAGVAGAQPKSAAMSFAGAARTVGASAKTIAAPTARSRAVRYARGLRNGLVKLLSTRTPVRRRRRPAAGAAGRGRRIVAVAEDLPSPFAAVCGKAVGLRDAAQTAAAPPRNVERRRACNAPRKGGVPIRPDRRGGPSPAASWPPPDDGDAARLSSHPDLRTRRARRRV